MTKSMHDYIGEYRAANKRRNRATRNSAPEQNVQAVEAAFWEKREAMNRARDRYFRSKPALLK